MSENCEEMSPKPGTRVLAPKRSQSKRAKPLRKKKNKVDLLKASESFQSFQRSVPTLPITESDYTHQRALRCCVHTTLKRRGHVR